MAHMTYHPFEQFDVLKTDCLVGAEVCESGNLPSPNFVRGADRC